MNNNGCIHSPQSRVQHDLLRKPGAAEIISMHILDQISIEFFILIIMKLKLKFATNGFK